MNQTTTQIPIRQIAGGFNYRRRFNEAKMAELVDDIRRQGVLQHILVRETGDGSYQVIAGNRRAKAVELAFGENATIPAIVRVMTDAEAMAAMVAENKVREDTTAIEDAEAASRMLGLLHGDREETAKRLGWSAQVLNARLGIMNATNKVRDAYIEEKILLGHVEILAALIKDVQDTVLEKMLARPKVPTVAELKAMAEQILLNLDAAIFDKTECASCHYNTGKQQTMFETSFEGTRCTNRACYEKKTENELEVRRSAMTEEYQVVKIVRPGDNMTVVPLRATGPKGVGDEQALACRTCGDFGACVSAAPDKLGMSFKDVCFNSTCNAEKIETYTKAQLQKDAESQAAAAAKTTESEAKTAVTGADAPARSASTGKPTSSPSDGAKASETPAQTKTAVSSEPRTAIKDYREKVWRKIFQRAALRLPVPQSRALLIALCLHSPRNLASLNATEAIAKATGRENIRRTDAGGLLNELLQLDQVGLSTSLQQIPGYVSGDLSIRSITEMLDALEVKMESHWKVNADLFGLLTKTEIDAVCVELGLDQAIGKEYSKLKAGSKSDYVKAVVGIEGFDYVGKIPAFMRW
jgi:ParB family chromosome partitioning protein